jgi:hypothetical protein
MAPRYHPDAVNAAAVLLALVAPATARRLGADAEARYRGDLVSLLNRLRKDELSALAARLRLAADDDVGGLRAALWRWGRPGGGRRLGVAGHAGAAGAVAARCAPDPRRASPRPGAAQPGLAAPHPAAAAAGPRPTKSPPTSICSWRPPIARSACACRRAVATRARGGGRRRRSSA